MRNILLCSLWGFCLVPFSAFATADVWHDLYKSDHLVVGYMSNHGYVDPTILRTLTAEANILESVLFDLKKTKEISDDTRVLMTVYSDVVTAGLRDRAQYEVLDTCFTSDARGEPLFLFDKKSCVSISVNGDYLLNTHDDLIAALLQSKTLYEKDQDTFLYKDIRDRYLVRAQGFKNKSFANVNIENINGYFFQEKAQGGQYFLSIGKDDVLLEEKEISTLLLKDPFWSEDNRYGVYVLPEGVFVYDIQSKKTQHYPFPSKVFDVFVRINRDTLMFVYDVNLFSTYHGVIVDIKNENVIREPFSIPQLWDYQQKNMFDFPWDHPSFPLLFDEESLVHQVDLLADRCMFEWKEQK